MKKTNKDNVMKEQSLTKIISCTSIIFIVTFIFVFLGEFNTKSLNITTHFSEIAKGNNTDGSPFDIQEIMSDSVLEEASDKLKGKIDAKEIKKHLTVNYHTDSEDMEKLRQNIRNGNTEYLSYPIMFRLTYSTVSEEIKNEGIIASIGAFFNQTVMPGKDEILEAVAESYQEYYNRRYVENGSILTVDWTETDSLDYYNKSVNINTKINEIIRLLQEKYNKNTEFVSKNSNVGFGDLCNEITGILNIDAENFKSFIIQNGLTNDRDKLLRQFRYMESYNTEKNERLTTRFNTIKETIEFYDSTVTKVVFIPALDYNDSFYMNRTKVGMDYLVESADNAKLAADDAKHNILNYQYLINQFSTETEYDIEKNVKADAMYEEIKTKVDAFSQKALEITGEESRENFEGITVGNVFTGIGIVSIILRTIKTFIILMSALCVLLYVYEKTKGIVSKDKRRVVSI